jgi:hypothetical protein
MATWAGEVECRVVSHYHHVADEVCLRNVGFNNSTDTAAAREDLLS